tara:strand:+ start:1795 stop:2016 length:222 start_codon:yes stop_codon:yes gene_type:complete
MSKVMKVRVDFEYDATLARAVNNVYGKSGRATAAEMRDWFHTYGVSANMDIVGELAEEIAEIRAETPDEEFAE